MGVAATAMTVVFWILLVLDSVMLAILVWDVIRQLRRGKDE